MNYNQLLGVADGASVGEIQQAFRKAAFESHPDLSDSPEAAEAFQRIKEARDKLMKQAVERQAVESVQQSTAAAVQATTSAAYAATTPVPDLYDGFTPEEIAYIQQLDRLAAKKPNHPIFGHAKESAEVKKHRKKLNTNNRRIEGLY